MNIEYQLQIDAIKGNRIFYKEYGKFIFVTDGRIGVYLKESELKIDKSKMCFIHEKPDSVSFDPSDLFAERTAAKETMIARKMSSGYAIKIYSEESGKFCYVSEKYLKMFKGYTNLYIKSRKDPVLVYKYGMPYGVIMPINIVPMEGEWWFKKKQE